MQFNLNITFLWISFILMIYTKEKRAKGTDRKEATYNMQFCGFIFVYMQT